MRITQELLHKIARETVKARQRSEADLHAAYLTGSLLTEEPLLGGTTDIDLVLVHKYQIPIERETVAVSREVSLDIIHKRKDAFDQHRRLRQDPWQGYPLTMSHILLADTDHWLEFIQAGVTADFYRSDNVLARVRSLLAAAREGWFTLKQSADSDPRAWLRQYLTTMALAANTIAGLIGPPLTTRRFLLTYAERVETLGVPNLLAGIYGLLGYSNSVEENLPQWTNALEADLARLGEMPASLVHLAPCRHAYYLDAIRAMTESGSPQAALWPLLKVWLDAQSTTTSADEWESCLQAIQLSAQYQPQKIEALDAYLDTVELVVEDWAALYGI